MSTDGQQQQAPDAVPPHVWAAAVQAAEQGVTARLLREALDRYTLAEWLRDVGRAQLSMPTVSVGGATLGGGSLQVQALVALLCALVASAWALPPEMRAPVAEYALSWLPQPVPIVTEATETDASPLP